MTHTFVCVRHQPLPLWVWLLLHGCTYTAMLSSQLFKLSAFSRISYSGLARVDRKTEQSLLVQILHMSLNTQTILQNCSAAHDASGWVFMWIGPILSHGSIACDWTKSWFSLHVDLVHTQVHLRFPSLQKNCKLQVVAMPSCHATMSMMQSDLCLASVDAIWPWHLSQW